MSDGSSRERLGELMGVQDYGAVDEDVFHSNRKRERFLKRGRIENSVPVEDHQVGPVVFFN